jgi:HAD superfamily hydrolase (TIGR01509 family)
MKQKRITLLDLGGVVFQSTGISNEKINWTIISQLNHKYGPELDIGKDRFPDFLREYNSLTEQNLIGKEFLKEIFDTLEINKELIELIRKESEIIIVSDNYRENIEYISKRYDFESWSIQQIYSFDYQMIKKNPSFFKRLIEEVKGYEVVEMLFIDDSIKKIESAAKSGIQGILYKNNGQVKEELSNIVFYKS